MNAKYVEPAPARGRSCSSAVNTARMSFVVFSVVLAVGALAGCANLLPAYDPNEFSNWSKAHLNLPIYPGSHRELKAAVGNTESYMVSTTASLFDVKTYYMTEPAKHGWHMEESATLKSTAQGCSLIAKQDDKEALLDLRRQNGKTFIGITYGPKGIYSGLQH